MSNSYTTSSTKNRRLILGLIFILALSGFATANSKHEKRVKIAIGDTAYPIGLFDMKRAERLFYGLIPIEGESKTSCVTCHYTNYIDTLNWNPSAYDIAAKYAGKNASELQKSVNKPIGKVMGVSHAGYNISDNQAVLLQAYLNKLHTQSEPGEKPVITNLFLFILINVLGLLFLIDLLVLHKIPYRALHLLVIIGVTIYTFKVLIVEGIKSGRQQNYQPTQPIKFSHKIHAGDNKIDCQYCHNLAEKSKPAGIPEASVCMNCHVIIVEGQKSGKFEINKILDAYEKMTPIQWVKIHNLPDHVYFNHSQHVGAGKLDCKECHGAVETMNVVKQVNTLGMGWCLDCHKSKKVDFENNNYYAVFKDFHEKIAQGKMDSVLVSDIGGTNCMKCHY